MKNWMKLLLLIVAGILFLIVYFGFLSIAIGLIFNTMARVDWIMPCVGFLMIIFAVVMLTKG
jgi:ABC-type Na+ efflux pump permease subunit